MATTTPNFGFDVPTSTDYVKDGATAIETLGDDIDDRFGDVTNFPDQLVNKVSSVSRPIPFSMQAGFLSMNTSTETITFASSRFTQTPIVTVSTQTATLGRGVTVSAVSSTSFTVIGFVTTTAGATTTAFNYHAIQMKSASGAG
jgi:hypothetical protein